MGAHYFEERNGAFMCKTWMHKFNSILGYYIIMCLSTYFIVLIMIIITVTVISMKAQLCMSNKCPSSYNRGDGEVLFFYLVLT